MCGKNYSTEGIPDMSQMPDFANMAGAAAGTDAGAVAGAASAAPSPNEPKIEEVD